MSMGLPISQQMYFSTHNALRAVEQDQKFKMDFHEFRGNRSVTLSIYPLYDIQMVKQLLIKNLGLSSFTSINDVRIFYKGIDIPNHRAMSTFEKSDRKVFWTLQGSETGSDVRETDMKLSSALENIVMEIRLAFKKNIAPKLTMDGTGGTYRMFNVIGKTVAIFKPYDEEAFAPFNPRGFTGKIGSPAFRRGILSGEGASREVAAYLIDSYYGRFAGVPETAMVEACNPNFRNTTSDLQTSTNDNPTKIIWKSGSLQKFINAKESCGNYNARLFSTHDVHRIGILDIRLMNLDRNDGNILVVPAQDITRITSTTIGPGASPCLRPSDRNLTVDLRPCRYRLIPIDHGHILPDTLDIAQIDLVWYDWPQSKVPFNSSELQLISSFDFNRDAERLRRKLFIRLDCLRSMKVATTLLQIGAKMHLNLYQIATISCRSDMDEPSTLERIIHDSMKQAYLTMDSTSLISTNRLGFTYDLAEPMVPVTYHDNSEKRNISSLKVRKATTDTKSADTSHHDYLNCKTFEHRHSASVRCANNGAFLSPYMANRFWNPSFPAPSHNLNSTFNGKLHRAIESSSSDSEYSDSSSDVMYTKSALRRNSSGALIVASQNSNMIEMSPRRSYSFGLFSYHRTHEDEDSLSEKSYCSVPLLNLNSRQMAFDNLSSSSSNSSNLPLHRTSAHHGFGHHHNRNASKWGSTGEPSFKSQFMSRPKGNYKFQSLHAKQTQSVLNTEKAKAEMLSVNRSRPAGSATVSRITGTTARGTAYRRLRPQEAGTTWTLQDQNGRQLPLNWDDDRFEKLFFEALIENLRQCIVEAHPDWKLYPYNGELQHHTPNLFTSKVEQPGRLANIRLPLRSSNLPSPKLSIPE